MENDAGSTTVHSQLKALLRIASRQQKNRNLSISCRFINELLVGMESTTVPGNTAADDISDIHEDEVDMVLFASNLMDMGDYLRCAYYLRKIYKINGVFQMKSSIGMFLGAYSLFLAGEKSKEQDSCEYIKRSENSKNNSKMNANKPKVNKETENASYNDYMFQTTEYSSRNPYLVDIYKELLPLYINYRSNVDSVDVCKMDGYLMFLFAIIVRNIRRYGGGPSGMPSELVDTSDTGNVAIPSTRELLIEAIRLCPWNWSSWLELIEEYCSLNSNRIPSWNDIMGVYSSDNHSSQVMYYIFLIHLHLELQQGEVALHILQSSGLLQVFPTSQILLNNTALSHYCLRDYDRAQEIFEMARDMDPHRLDHVDTYSNILYVKERRAELSHLAHAVTRADKFIPESNCVVGNYYSLKGQHERAILYFQRALKLNNQCISAWTLMGHEYVELRNTASAVQCYRKAVDVSTRDYRAWYGLGQTYEMLHMYQYALYYYKKAAALKPSDARMWCAVGNCFSRLGSKKDAMLTLEKAVHCGDREGIATRELARLYRENGNTTKAAECYHKHLNTLGFNQANQSNIDPEKAEGIIFLANYHRNKSDLTHAEEYCNYLVDYIGPEGDEARAMQREIRSYFQTNNGVGVIQPLNYSNTSFSSDRGGILPDSDDER